MLVVNLIPSKALMVIYRNIGHLLDVLETLKLQLSYQKSHVLISVAGSNSRNALKGRLAQQSAGRCILIPRATGDKTPLPMSSQSKYLGVIMSYGAFEDQTWQHRRKSGLSAFARLKPWLTNSRIARHRRLYLWRVCIHTILTYGILATNVTVKVLHDYQAVVYRMLRTIVGDHPYRTRHTHQQVLNSISHPLPLDLLQAAAMGNWHRVQRRTELLHPEDFLFCVKLGTPAGPPAFDPMHQKHLGGGSHWSPSLSDRGAGTVSLFVLPVCYPFAGQFASPLYGTAWTEPSAHITSDLLVHESSWQIPMQSLFQVVYYLA